MQDIAGAMAALEAGKARSLRSFLDNAKNSAAYYAVQNTPSVEVGIVIILPLMAWVIGLSFAVHIIIQTQIFVSFTVKRIASTLRRKARVGGMVGGGGGGGLKTNIPGR
jgi:hypothetical protein